MQIFPSNSQQQGATSESPALSLIRKKLAEAQDFSVVLTEIAFFAQESIDDGNLDAGDVMDEICSEGAQRSLARTETAKKFGAALKAVRKARQLLASQKTEPKPLTTKPTKDQFSENPLQIPVVCLKDIEAQVVEYLWYPYIPKRKLTLATGQEGIGKSWLTCAIAACITNGKGLPGASVVEQGNVLMLSAEDGLADTVKPRLLASGADCERVFAPQGKFTFDEKGLSFLSEMIAEYRPLLVIIDPLFAYTGAKVDINKANEARAISTRLADIAENLDTSLFLIRHFNKAKGHGDSRHAGMSSIDWCAAARVELLIGVDPDDPSKRAIIHDKHNLSEQGKSLGFTIRDGQFFWTGESNLTAARILSSVGNEEEAQGRNDAEDFLREILSSGAKPAKEIQREARDAGLTDWQLRSAKARLRIQPFKRGGNFGGEKGWFWSLPEDAEDEAISLEDVKENNISHLQQNHNGKSSYRNGLAEDVEDLFSPHLQQSSSHLQVQREVIEI